MKSGIKTTEFWVALSGIGGIVWTFAQQHCQVNQTELMVLGGIIITYIGGRSWVKSRQS